MEVRVATQRPSGPKKETLRAKLAEAVATCGCDNFGAAAAYVTVEGVRTVLKILDGQPLKQSRWLVGLDDAISQPGAIDLLMTLPHAEVRVVTFAATGARFHTKLIHFAKGGPTNSSGLMVGSANLSRAAFERNAEAAIFLLGQTMSEAKAHRAAFEEVWELGHSPTDKELAAYKERYGACHKLRKKLDEISNGEEDDPNIIVTPDASLIDPAQASICWIECGKITLFGKELELKGDQAAFFDLNPTGGETETFSFICSDGKTRPIRIIFRENKMWRVYFTSDVPEVASGLRPTGPDGKLGRSPFVAVFKKTKKPKTFDLQFVRDDSKEYIQLQNQSKKTGTIGNTGSRKFGWC